MTDWCSKRYGFPLSAHSSAFLQGSVESIPTCTGMAWQIWKLIRDDNKWYNYQIYNKAWNWKIINLVYISHYPIYLKRMLWEKLLWILKKCWKFIRPCKRHLPNLWAISWPLTTFITAVCGIDLLKCTISWGRYSVLSECLRDPWIQDFKQLCKQNWQCLSEG